MQRPRHDGSRRTPFFLLTALAAILVGGCSAKNVGYSRSESGSYSSPTQAPYIIKNVKYYPIPDATGYRERGIASWYGDYFHGRPTSNGETYDMYEMTAAHKILPMNTRLRVRNLDNGREITVRVNDRGPFVDGRVIDLSYTAAERLDMLAPGTARVEITALPSTIVRPEKSPTSSAQASGPKIASTASTGVPRQKPASTKELKANKTPTKLQDKEQPTSTFGTLAEHHPSPSADIQKETASRTNIESAQSLLSAEDTLYYVKVGRFFEMEQALRLKKRFIDAGHAAVIDTGNDEGRQTYLVHVFAGRKLSLAKKAEADLLASGYTGASVVIR